MGLNHSTNYSPFLNFGYLSPAHKKSGRCYTSAVYFLHIYTFIHDFIIKIKIWKGFYTPIAPLCDDKRDRLQRPSPFPTKVRGVLFVKTHRQPYVGCGAGIFIAEGGNVNLLLFRAVSPIKDVHHIGQIFR